MSSSSSRSVYKNRLPRHRSGGILTLREEKMSKLTDGLGEPYAHPRAPATASVIVDTPPFEVGRIDWEGGRQCGGNVSQISNGQVQERIK